MIFMNHRIISASIALAILLTGSLSAHHSAGAVFDFSKTLTLTGTLTKVDWRNPHIHVSLEAKSDRGQVETWVMEVASPKWFRDRNVSKSEFETAIGQIVTVEGFHARDGSRNGYLEKITFRDGHSVVGFLVNR
jgi:hypothetical protein